VAKNFDSKVPAITKKTEKDDEFIANVNQQIGEYITCLEKVALKDGLRVFMNISRLGNQYLQECQPWKAIKGDIERAQTVMAICIHVARTLALLVEPYLPAVTAKIGAQLNLELLSRQLDKDCLVGGKLQFDIPAGHKLGIPEPIFREIPVEEADNLRLSFQGIQNIKAEEAAKVLSSDEFTFDLRVGQIVHIENHAESEKLYICKVDLGEDSPRVIVSGLRAFYTPEELSKKKVIVVCNLKYAKLRGVVSQGMLLTAEKGALLGLLTSDKPNGTKIVADNCKLSVKDKPLDKNAFDKTAIQLLTNENSNVIFAGKYTLVAGDQPIIAERVKEGASIR